MAELFPAMSTIFGHTIVENKSLSGCKRAVQIGDGPIHVSPAMLHLIMTAETDEELRRILGTIKVLRLPKSVNLFGLADVTTTFPSGENGP